MIFFSPSGEVTLLENHSKFFTVKSIHSSELKEQGHKDDIKATVPQMSAPAHAPAPTEFEGVHCCVYLGGAGPGSEDGNRGEEKVFEINKAISHMFRVLSKQQNSRVQLCIWKEGRRVGERWPFPQSWSLLISLPHKPFVVSGPQYGCSV